MKDELLTDFDVDELMKYYTGKNTKRGSNIFLINGKYTLNPNVHKERYNTIAELEAGEAKHYAEMRKGYAPNDPNQFGDSCIYDTGKWYRVAYYTIVGNSTNNYELFVRAEGYSDAKAKAAKAAKRIHRSEKICPTFDMHVSEVSEQEAKRQNPSIVFDSEVNMKDTDFSKQTKQGYQVLEMYRDGGRLHVIFKRANDYGIGLGYDTIDGQWAQGRYDFSTLEKARKALVEEKPYARRIQDSVNDDNWSSVEEENYKKANEEPLKKDTTRQTIIEKLRSISVPYGERWQLIDGSGWTIDIQHHGLSRYENIELAEPDKNRHVSPKEYSKATIRIWYNSKMMKKIEGPLNVAKSEAIRFLQSQTHDSVEKVFSVSYTKDGVTYINKVKAANMIDAIAKCKDATFSVQAWQNGKLVEEQTVSNRNEADKIAKEFEKKYGEYSTSIKVNW